MVAEERDKCDQRLHRAKLKVETMATEVSTHTHTHSLTRLPIHMQLSMSAMLRSVQEKAINNKLMERVHLFCTHTHTHTCGCAAGDSYSERQVTGHTGGERETEVTDQVSTR